MYSVYIHYSPTGGSHLIRPPYGYSTPGDPLYTDNASEEYERYRHEICHFALSGTSNEY